MPNQRELARLLVAEGRRLAAQPRQRIRFTGDDAVDALLNDIERAPHMFVLGCVVDRQVRTEQSWRIPWHIAAHAGGPEFARLAALSEANLQALFAAVTAPIPSGHGQEHAPGHPPDRRQLQGDAARIWSDCPSSAELVYRFLAFPGVGPKIATMAANILTLQFRVPLADHYSIDISPDVHVRRVFTRLGLVPEGASVEQIIYRARHLHPEFPGLLDQPAYLIGRQWCRPQRPVCGECLLGAVCPTAAARHGK